MTLIEILVVVAIIAILAAIMFPLVGKMQDSARMSECIQQLRAIGQGISLYGADRDGRFPGLGMSAGSRWLHQVAPYMDMKADTTVGGIPCYSSAYDLSMFKCSMVGRWKLPAGQNPNKFDGRYALNRKLYNDSANQSDPSAMLGYSRNIVQRPTQTVMIAESCIGGPGSDNKSFPDQRQDQGVSANHRSDRNPFNGPNGPSNYLFVDGHVETRTNFIGANAFDPSK